MRSTFPSLLALLGSALLASCSSTPPAAVQCESGQTACGSVCANLQESQGNCGACGVSCAADESCVKGACYANDCEGTDCSASQVCPSSRCEEKACVGVVCPSGQACLGGVCVDSTCTTGSCGAGFACVNNACTDVACLGVRCPSGSVCRLGVCTMGTCMDGLVSTTETDVDCGGACPTKCAQGQACIAPTDCASATCTGGRCAAPSTCTNGQKDTDETDVDCGGACQAKCIAGQGCQRPEDCVTMGCSGNVCSQGAGCVDGAKNGQETDVDCGGPECTARCADTKACTTGADCASGNCTANACAGPSCTDGRKNGQETDVDCGGACTAKCAAGRGCRVGTDCVDKVCGATSTCSAPTCTDLALNGTESDVDCGGTCPRKCTTGMRCNTGSDCLANMCLGVICAADPTCTDGQKNQDEVDVDCGGASCPACANGKVCNTPTDCQYLFCQGAPKVCSAGFPTYVDSATYGNPYGARRILAGRFNADAYPDLMVDRYDELRMYPGTASGVPSAVSQTPVTPAGIVDLQVGDVTGDGRDDAVVLISTFSLSDVQILPGNGTGGFQTGYFIPSELTPPIGSNTANTLLAMDFDRPDAGGRVDLAVGYTGSGAGSPRQFVSVLVNQGGTFAAPVEFTVGTTASRSPVAMVSGDFNQDGLPDIAIGFDDPGGTNVTGEVKVLLGSGGGTFTLVPTGTAVPNGVNSLGVGDFNEDGRVDLLSLGDNSSGTYNILFGQPNGTFQVSANYPTGGNGTGISVADFNGDGNLDFAFLSSGVLQLRLGDGTGQFRNGQTQAISGGAMMSTFDLDVDGRPDLVVRKRGGGSENLSTYLNR